MDSVLSLTLSLISGLAWTATYILIIRRNSLEKTYGMPLVALGLNISWELIFSFIVRPAQMDDAAWVWIGINATWLLFDIVILIQTVRYGIKESWSSKQFFYVSLAAALVFSFLGQLALTFQFQDWEGRWTAFPNTLVMSILFIMMLDKRGIRGQSIYIALTKLIGTLAVGISYLLSDPTSPLQWYTTLAILFFDGLYTIALYKKIRAASINPWKHL